jgi:nucleoside-diphosphate-sugar epimerase
MTILITGGTGTLGTQVVRRLAHRGLKVRATQRAVIEDRAARSE